MVALLQRARSLAAACRGVRAELKLEATKQPHCLLGMKGTTCISRVTFAAQLSHL